MTSRSGHSNDIELSERLNRYREQEMSYILWMLFYIGFGYVFGWSIGYREGHKDGYQRGKAISRHISQLVK